MGRTLKLASFNIQTGIHTRRYEDYLFKSWQHLWPSDKRLTTLERIAGFLRSFDIVGLQEVDGGGSRSHYVVQTEYLARQAGFPYWHNQVNRRIGRVALHSNGFLSRMRPDSVHATPLPGLPGRGAIWAHFGQEEEGLLVCVLHLALSPRARRRQLDFVAEYIADTDHVIVMGDLNCGSKAPELRRFLARTGLVDPVPHLRTFPSWQPLRKLDHILISPNLTVKQIQAYDFVCSDHLPIGMEFTLPAALPLAA
ncbi:MAG: endonuclease/exonuclease/phosphatase family protein [Methylohalobius sp. ZOD2]